MNIDELKEELSECSPEMRAVYEELYAEIRREAADEDGEEAE